jgi:hypothetical protein
MWSAGCVIRASMPHSWEDSGTRTPLPEWPAMSPGNEAHLWREVAAVFVRMTFATCDQREKAAAMSAAAEAVALAVKLEMDAL